VVVPYFRACASVCSLFCPPAHKRVSLVAFKRECEVLKLVVWEQNDIFRKIHPPPCPVNCKPCQFDPPSGERARRMIFGSSSCFYVLWTQKESVFRGFLFPQFFCIKCCVNESKTGHLKNAEERPETIESSQSLHRLAIERFFRQSSNARAREEVDSNLGIFRSKIHLSSGPPGEKAVQIAFC
jgi:hypothetical protein